MIHSLQIKGNLSRLVSLFLLLVAGSAWAQLTVTGTNQTGPVPFTPSWTPASGSLISGLVPTVANGNFGQYTNANANNLTQAGTPLTIYSYNTPQATKLEVCGNNGTAGSLLVYTLPASTLGYDLTNITVYGGWQDSGRDSQAYTVSYSTVANPTTFISLTQANYSPSGVPAGSGCANRVMINDASGAAIAGNVAALKFDFTTPASENGAVGYTAITVQGTAATQMTEPYPNVSSGGYTGPDVPFSPDPLVTYRWAHPQASDRLQIYLQKPVTVTADTSASFTNLQSLTGNSPNVTVNGVGSIKMDFGRESAAWLEFDSSDLTGSVEMSISEYNEPEITQYGGTHNVKTLAPAKYGNTYRLELNSLLYEGVRFGWIHVRSFGSPWHITGIRLVCQTKPANYDGSFSCSDAMLNRIWYTAAYTVKLNLLATEFGAILVDRGDRGSFTGDAHCSQAASLVAFGNYDSVKQNIVNTAGENNGIIGYSLYWVLSLLDYYNYTGDATTLSGYIDNVVSKLDYAYGVYGTNPSLVFYGWDERLGGFENPSCAESQKAYKMLCIRSWKEFAATMGAFGRTDLQAKYNGYANAKIAELRQNAAWYQDFGLHACADAVNTGLLNNTEKSTIFTQQFTDRVNRLSFSPFNQFFILQAFATMDKYDDALNTINDLWGSEISYGGTTFFELSRPSWNATLGLNDPVPNCQSGFTSLCHPWSAGVTKWLSEEVLGIKPASPGFATYRIAPHLGRTLTYVTGKTPTPLGSIEASFNVATGICNVTAPAGTVGTVGIPKVEKNISRITINGTLAWDGAFHPVAGIGGTGEDSEFVYLTGVQPGTYAMVVSYLGATPAYHAPAEHYAARFVKADATTSGNWGGVYGKDGYVLCNYNGNSTDKKSLPSYVSSVSYYMAWGSGKPNAANWISGTSDTRALAADSGNQGNRTAASYYTDYYVGVRNTMTFNINCTGSNYYQVALYFVDWDNRGRRLAVELHDANTLDLVAPVKVITDFAGGKYLVYTYNKSAKFRIDHVLGDNAVLSGIFFDPAPANNAPKVSAIGDEYIYAGQTEQLAVAVTDADSAFQTLTYSLVNAPAGASIDPATGVISWATTAAAAPGTNSVTVRVTDNGIPPLSDEKTFSVIVSGPPRCTGVALGGDGNIRITIDSLPGQDYQLQSNDNLTDGNWTTLGGIIPGTGSPLTFFAAVDSSPHRFFRLQAHKRPYIFP